MNDKPMFRLFKLMWKDGSLERDELLLALAKDIKNGMVNRLILVDIIEFLAKEEKRRIKLFKRKIKLF